MLLSGSERCGILIHAERAVFEMHFEIMLMDQLMKKQRMKAQHSSRSDVEHQSITISCAQLRSKLAQTEPRDTW